MTGVDKKDHVLGPDLFQVFLKGFKCEIVSVGMDHGKAVAVGLGVGYAVSGIVKDEDVVFANDVFDGIDVAGYHLFVKTLICDDGSVMVFVDGCPNGPELL